MVLLFSYSTISFFIFNLNVFLFFVPLNIFLLLLLLIYIFIIPLLLLAHKYKTNQHNIANRRVTQLHDNDYIITYTFLFQFNSYIFHSFINIYSFLCQSSVMTISTNHQTEYIRRHFVMWIPNRGLLWTVVTVKLTFFNLFVHMFRIRSVSLEVYGIL